MFTAALCTKARTWKQSKCPSAEEWIKKIWCMYIYMYTHIMEYYSAIKRNKIMTFAATWMELESIIQSGVRERQILCALTYMLACPLSRSYLCLEHIMLYIRAVSSSWMLG